MYFDQSAFAKRLSKLRERAGLTQEVLSEKLHHGTKYVNKLEGMERGPSIDSILELAEIFHVSTDYLLTGQNFKEDSPKEKLMAVRTALDKIIQEI